jgi:hypothetical protein
MLTNSLRRATSNARRQEGDGRRLSVFVTDGDFAAESAWMERSIGFRGFQ